MIQAKPKQCIKCPKGELKILWKSNPPLCRYHAHMDTAKTEIVKNKSIVDEDKKFYEWIWNKRDHFCEECGKELKSFSIDYFHHILPKKKGIGGYPYFRHEEKNIVILCGRFGCHGKAESATSYPKMKIFHRCEEIKFELLDSVGITYETKTQPT